jgi:CheY-like chemotaxis protein
LTPPLRILHLEDNVGDAGLVQAALESDGFAVDVTRVDTQDDFRFALTQRFDVILADNTLPAFDGLSALMLAMEVCPHVPFIFVSGTLGEEVAVEALKRGANDYVLKSISHASALRSSVSSARPTSGRSASEPRRCWQARSNCSR